MFEAYSTPEFEAEYTYTGSDLGCTWSQRKTAFRLWAPTAQEVTINLYRSGDPYADDLLFQLTMHPDVQGTWFAERVGDLQGLYYTYLVYVDGHITECCDPYARTTGVNGHRAMILNLASCNPKGWDQDGNPNASLPISDCILYELHIRDLSMHRSGNIRHRGKYLGLAETGRKTKSGISTGLDHIKSLGVTHIHLLPVYDFGFTDESRRSPQFNWGYDPVNFNVPEGSYSTDPFHGEVRVREFKKMVKALHDNGLSVVMDVVYNHVYDGESFCFNQIVPGYFSRVSPDGTWSNGSCCGNDTASERSMVRKYIIDSVKYWADEYHIDGFRFDLVGLIDVQTLRDIMAVVHKTHPDVIFYGEGWTMNTQVTKPDVPLAVQGNSHLLPGFSFFSDTIRDTLRGSVFFQDQPGFVSGAHISRDQLTACFTGTPAWCAQPYQSVNYVSCHDNHTLFDRVRLAAPEAPRESQVRMNNLAAAFTLLSQGVPFLQAGEEMLRTKPGKKGTFDHNSYRAPDRVNSLKWEDLEKEEYARNVCYYRGLIALRKAFPGLRLASRDQVQRQVRPVPHDNPHVAVFQIEDRLHDLFLIFNADTHDVMIHLPHGNWDVHVHDQTASASPLERIEGWAHCAPLSATVLSRRKPVDVVAALIWEKDKFLICQRPAGKARGLLWEFVGGKVEPGETKRQALIRECMEELAITIEVRDKFMEVIHEYPDMLIRLTLYHSVIPQGFPQALEHNDLAWIHPSQTDDYEFCPADTDILKEIKRVYQKRKPL